MARIRSLKPEFPQSESMGKVSRDARLLFIMLWTVVDDSGRTRGNSRMLASILFPYDDDAPSLIDAWLTELEQERCIQRYSVEGSTYLQICNWLIHQKIDKPTPSKLPSPRESSRTLANPTRRKGEEGKGIGRELEGSGEDGSGCEKIPAPTHPAPSTKSGEACKAIREAGVPDGNPSHPTLLSLIEAGATVDEFRQTAIECVVKGKASFAYVIGTVRKRREEAAKLKLHKGRMPNKQEALEASNNAVGEEWERKMREQMAAAEGVAANAG